MFKKCTILDFSLCQYEKLSVDDDTTENFKFSIQRYILAHELQLYQFHLNMKNIA